MTLEHFVRFGYSLIAVSFLLMIWISYIGGIEIEPTPYSPCYFNPLCSCSKAVPDLGIVQCRDINLPKILQRINISKVSSLYLENNGLRTIEPYFLQNTGLYSLTITSNPISLLPNQAFYGLDRSLWELDLSNNELIRVPSRAIRHLQKLRFLDLSGNEISQIFSDSWRGLENSLDTLMLAENSISHLPPDAFAGLPLLETLDLHGNSLRTIDPSIFREGMGKIAHINFADNQLSQIPYQALAPLKKLKTLDLSYNRISKMKLSSADMIDSKISLDLLKLDYNQIIILEEGSLHYFDNLNGTYLDGNPLTILEENAFRDAKIRELYMRHCGLYEISPGAFSGLENYLQVLDLSGNNFTTFSQTVFNQFVYLRALSLKDNSISALNPIEAFTDFQFTLSKLDISGVTHEPVSLENFRRLKSLRSLTLSRLSTSNLASEDFVEFGTDLEELNINFAGLETVKAHAFVHIHNLKKIDLSENSIEDIEEQAFDDVSLSLTHLKLSHAFSHSMRALPVLALENLINLEELDLSNNRIKSMPEISFHFLNKLKTVKLNDNVIGALYKGTFQDLIHKRLETIYLSFNDIRSIGQNAFDGLPSLQQIHLDDNRIETLEEQAFKNLEKLERLNLKGNKIGSISYEAFQNLPNLEELDMSYNSLENFAFSAFDQVGRLSMFRLNISHNRIRHLGSNINLGADLGTGGLHSNIKILDLSFNNVSTISPQYFHPAGQSLTHLYLHHNSLVNISLGTFGIMMNLHYLDASHNRIYDIDYDTFKDIRYLQILHLSHNNLFEISNDLFRPLQNLRIIDLSHNRIRFLPDILFRDDGLERINLSHNELNRLPLSSLANGAAATLCEIDLSWNSISSFAHGGLFSKFRSLSWLDLSHNHLVELDIGAFSLLPKLIYLDLSHNSNLVLERNGQSFRGVEDSVLFLKINNISLTSVPELPFTNLLSLSMSHNYLSSIRTDLALNMTSLRELDLSYNNLSAVPIATHSLPQLKSFSLAGNPIPILSNNSLLGVADHLETLDVTDLDLVAFETGALNKINSLRTLRISVYPRLRDINIPKILEHNDGLKNLEIQVLKVTDLKTELFGYLPHKLNNLTISGPLLMSLDSDVLEGVRSPVLRLNFRNTSLTTIPGGLFSIAKTISVSVDVRHNEGLKQFENPSTGIKPQLPRHSFLINLWMSGNNWNCDCSLGWIEIWQRKRRQYLCDSDARRSCRHVDDDLRSTVCSNKANQSLIEVLKTDIECGWSSSGAPGFFVSFILLVIELVVFVAN